MTKKLTIIGELMNNSYARARNAFIERDVSAYQALGKSQTALGASFLTLNLDGTQRIQVRKEEMLDFLPDVVSAIQEATSTPLSFDNPSIDYHKVALKHYDRKKSGQAILNSIAASRERLDEMIELVAHHDTRVIVMALRHCAVPMMRTQPRRISSNSWLPKQAGATIKSLSMWVSRRSARILTAL